MNFGLNKCWAFAATCNSERRLFLGESTFGTLRSRLLGFGKSTFRAHERRLSTTWKSTLADSNNQTTCSNCLVVNDCAVICIRHRHKGLGMHVWRLGCNIWYVWYTHVFKIVLKQQQKRICLFKMNMGLEWMNLTRLR